MIRNFSIYKLISIIVYFYLTSLSLGQDLNLDNRLRLAQSYELVGQLNKAEEIYFELYNAQPANYQFFDLLNKIYISQKKYNFSIKLIESKIKLTPMDINLYGMLGSTYFTMDKRDSAFTIWEKGIAVNLSSSISYRVIANYAIENRAYEKAIDILSRGKEFTNDPLMFSIDLANIYAANMKFENAAMEFCSLIAVHPDQLQVVKSRMSAYLNRPGAAEETIETLKKNIDSKAKIELYKLLSFVYQSNGEYKSAFEITVAMEKKFNGIGTHLFIFAQEAYRDKQFQFSADAYKIIANDFPMSPYFQLANFGYAKSLEALLDQKFYPESESWKPLTVKAPKFIDEYKKLKNAYEIFTKDITGNSLNPEALFRIAEIFRTRIFDFKKADSTYDQMVKVFSKNEYSVKAFLAKGKISIELGNLSTAKNNFEQVTANQSSNPDEIAEATYYLAQIEFWTGSFSKSLEQLKKLNKNLSADFTNDALELAALISSSKKDSLNLMLFAKADLLLLQNNLQQAAIEFKTLSDNSNLFIINEFSKIKLVEIFICTNEYQEAINLLIDITINQKNAVFIEKAAFLLAKIYHYGLSDLVRASEIYQKILENFPNSLYFDRARDALNGISLKTDKNE